MKKYLLDSNVFIQAHRMHYPFDVVPSFWKKLIELSNKGIVISIDKVKKEICDTKSTDVLSLWCLNEINNDFFVDSSPCIAEYSDIANWTYSNNHFKPTAKDEFLATDLADPWLIAYARNHNCIIVTHETSQPNKQNRIKIPEPCLHFGVKYLTPIQMLRELKETL